jgi:hypothetical protein
MELKERQSPKARRPYYRPIATTPEAPPKNPIIEETPVIQWL